MDMVVPITTNIGTITQEDSGMRGCWVGCSCSVLLMRLSDNVTGCVYTHIHTYTHTERESVGLECACVF